MIPGGERLVLSTYYCRAVPLKHVRINPNNVTVFLQAKGVYARCWLLVYISVLVEHWQGETTPVAELTYHPTLDDSSIAIKLYCYVENHRHFRWVATRCTTVPCR